MSEVFAALADPTRRRILDRLRRRGAMSVTDVAAPFEMTRQGATKHLDQLVNAGLVSVRWKGRRRLHELDAGPLREVDDWLAPYAAEWDRRLDRLRHHLERDRSDSPSPTPEDTP